MASRRASRPTAPPARLSAVHSDEEAAGRRRRLVRPLALVVSALTVTGALVAVVVAPAQAERPAQERVQIGKNWDQPVQNAQPNEKAVAPADRGRRMTPAQRLSRVRPMQPNSVPSPAPSGRAYVPASSESGK